MLGSKGIRVNAVAPGPIWTPLIPSTMPPEKVKSFGKDTPLGRAGQPRELAGIFVLLASDRGQLHMTGGIDAVTGGKPLLKNRPTQRRLATGLGVLVGQGHLCRHPASRPGGVQST